jgi:hypothetical protein
MAAQHVTLLIINAIGGAAAIGSAHFAIHTAVLDMLLWPILFRLQS